MINKLKSEIIEIKYLLLFFIIDVGPSFIDSKISGIFKSKSASELFEKENIIFAKEITSEIKNLGFNVNLAPVYDFPTNREIIGERFYGNEKNHSYGNRVHQRIS